MGTTGAFDQEARAAARHDAAQERDDAALERDAVDEVRDVAADDRDAEALQRERRGARREQLARDKLWEQQRHDAESQGWLAGTEPATDPSADYEQALVDLNTARSEIEMIRGDFRDFLDQTRQERREAADDRQASLRDRTHSRESRHQAASDRQAAAAERGQAEIDRNLEAPPSDHDR